jgi:hypothetical protein
MPSSIFPQRVPDHFQRLFNDYVPRMTYSSDVTPNQFYRVDFGINAVTDPDAILDGTDIAVAGSTTTLLSNESDAPYGRNLTVVASGAAVSTVTVRGRDYLGQPMVELLTLNGAVAVPGVKAFYWVESVTWGATADRTIDLGWGLRFGLPYRSTHIIAATVNGAADANTGTFTAAVFTDPQTNATTDPRGLWTPNTAPNGARRHTATFIVDASVNANDNGGMHGIAHFYA